MSFSIWKKAHPSTILSDIRAVDVKETHQGFLRRENTGARHLETLGLNNIYRKSLT